MHFLYPGFLFALLSLAIPVVIHLFNFRRYEKVNFSNVQFLKELQERQSSRRNIKERLLLAARLLSLLFLILAFSKPYIADGDVVNQSRQRMISIFVDNSYSMQALSKEGTLLDEARRDAKEIAASYGMNDRFQLLTQDFKGRHQRLLNRDEFIKEVDEVKISPQSRSLQQIVNRQQSLLHNQSGKSTLYILSDFQKNIGNQPLPEDSNLQINLFQLKPNTLPNVAIDSVALINATHQPGANEKLIIKLHNYADEKAEKIPVKLLVNGTQKALASFSLAPRAVQYDTLSFSGLTSGWQNAELQLQDNPVVFDNNFYFTFNVPAQLQVLLINGGSVNPFLQAVFSTDNFFKVTHSNSGNVNFASLGNYNVIVISDIKEITAGLSQQLKNYVFKGGSLVVFQSADEDLKSYQQFLQSLGAAYPQKLITENTKVSFVNTRSTVFNNVFEHIPENPDLPQVKKYYQLSANQGNGYESLMQLLNGQPFLASYHAGKGKIYEAAVALNEDFSNLPRHALLVPLMLRIGLISGRDQQLYYTIGKTDIVEVAAMVFNEKSILKLTKNNESIIPDSRQQEGSTLLYLSDQVKNSGNYTLKRGDSIVSTIAFNNNRKESDLSYWPAAQLKQMAPGANVLSAHQSSVKNQLAEIHFGRQLWKVCIILALLFIAAEILLARYYKINIQSSMVSV